MPKSKEYVSSSSSSENSDNEVEVKSQKRKSEKIEKKEKPSKRPKQDKKEEDEPCWELGNNRFVEVKEFKGKTYVDIREKYLDASTCDWKPGKKGLFLTIPQWKKLTEVIGQVDEALSKL